MSPLREAFSQHLTLRRVSQSTHNAYINAVKGLSVHYWKSPDQLSDEEIRDYFVYLLKDGKYAWSTGNVIFCGIKMFYKAILDRDLDNKVNKVIPPRPRQKQIPAILSQEEVAQLLRSCDNLKHRTLLLCAYSSGLRVSEIVSIEPVHIERNRMMIRVEQGKGRKDRYTILSPRFLKELEDYWREYRPGRYIFFGSDKSRPMAIGTAQQIYYKAKERAGITRGRGIHTLRHCFATHLMENGVAIHVIKRMMGHVALSTTAGYIHVSKELISTIKSPLDELEEINNLNNSMNENMQRWQ